MHEYEKLYRMIGLCGMRAHRLNRISASPVHEATGLGHMNFDRLTFRCGRPAGEGLPSFEKEKRMRLILLLVLLV